MTLQIKGKGGLYKGSRPAQKDTTRVGPYSIYWHWSKVDPLFNGTLGIFSHIS